MYSNIVKRLKSLGYIVVPADKWVIRFLIEKVTNAIKNDCNVDAIPEGLRQIAVDMVCGEFLQMKNGSGQLVDTSINTEAAIKQIREGDTSITYAVADGAVSSFDGLIDFLLNYGKPQFAAFRRMRW